MLEGLREPPLSHLAARPFTRSGAMADTGHHWCMSLPERVYVGRHRTTLNGQAQLTGALLGAASGMAINTFSDDVGYPGTVGVFALAATVTAAM